jgi:hypothetical protein
MKAITPLTRFVLGAFLLATAGIGVAQKHGDDDGPPGQAKKHGYDDGPPGQAKKHGYDGVPPGQAKKYRGDYRFQSDDRDRFYAHYRGDADQWRGRRRPVFVTGRAIPREYVVRTVPQSYWVGAPPPPPGYQYGYYGGYVVAYDPTTRVIGDVLDLVGAMTSR